VSSIPINNELYSTSSLPTFSHLLQTFQPFHPIRSGSNAPGAAFFYNKNKEGKWYAPDFDSASKKQNPLLGGSNGERFGNGVAISDTAFVVGAPYFSDFEGKAVAYSYTSATNP